jgi:hypothetical protein
MHLYLYIKLKSKKKIYKPGDTVWDELCYVIWK